MSLEVPPGVPPGATPAAFAPWQHKAMRFVRSKTFAEFVDNPSLLEAFKNYFSPRNPGFTTNHWEFPEKKVSLTLGPQGLVMHPQEIRELREAYEAV